MAKCISCKREMTGQRPVGCTSTKVVFRDNTIMDRLKYPSDRDDNCHDCNTGPGQYHHDGCDMETCPSCFGQLIGHSCHGGVYGMQ